MKRTPLARKTPLRSKPADGKPSPKPVKCKAPGCSNRFVRRSMTHKACGPDCAAALVAQDRAKQAARAARAEAAEHRAKLAAYKPLSHWLKATERVVNHYVLTRDRALPCISCGTYDTVQWEAGHFKSVGAHPEMRFLTRNIHKQCHRCNVQLSGNIHGYRAGLLARYGRQILDELDVPHPLQKYTREGLEEIRADHAAATRAMKAAANDDQASAAA